MSKLVLLRTAIALMLLVALGICVFLHLWRALLIVPMMALLVSPLHGRAQVWMSRKLTKRSHRIICNVIGGAFVLTTLLLANWQVCGKTDIALARSMPALVFLTLFEIISPLKDYEGIRD